MSTAIESPAASLLERVVIGGDLSKLAPADRLQYYKAVCQSCGLNPLTRPFDYLQLSGRLVLYARKDATDQLRTLRLVSIDTLTSSIHEGVYVVTARARDKDERTDISTGAVWIEGLKGQARADAMMKAETKAKRRVTLSICGLGMLDETEIESIPGSLVVPVDPMTGEIDTPAPDVNDSDRSNLVSEIAHLHERIGSTRAQINLKWARMVGPNVAEQDAPIEKLMALRDHLAGQVA